jgi:hypothetical protein
MAMKYDEWCKENCPYYQDCYGAGVCNYVKSLLEERDPRVLTADELYLMEHKGVYLERRNSQLYLTEPAIVIGTSKFMALEQYKYILMRENKISDVRYSGDYNKETKSGWRCWTTKPTEEQRKEVKWDA